MAESTNESDSNEKMSTTDELDSHWTDEDDSESGSESDEEDEDEFSISGTAEGAKERAKKMRKRSSRRKRTLQSDTETRNLLDDVGDDEDIMDLEESKENSKDCGRPASPVSMAGALSGGDERVVDFFRKSRLDTKTLSKVWALADVNADGFLNHAEFILAMHLIVLHGRLPVPSRVPSPVRPCATPPRFLYPLGAELQNSTASSTLSSAADNASTSRGSDPSQPPASTARPPFHQHSQPPNPNGRLMPMSTLSADVAANKQQSLSDDHLHVHTQQREVIVTDFSDAPPVLVDNRPTPLNGGQKSARHRRVPPVSPS
ncbi:hypothetical protein M3Y99_01215700 [Aphelenchoides fujianensis]|nr:hypothetical protein M3Y99_01215700 [Aphelenchoides fujianensis]